MNNHALCRFLLIFAILMPFGAAQIEPDSAQVLQYFPQLADGGTRAQQWQTTFVFVNPSVTSTAGVILNIYDNNGSPLGLDLGSGLSSTLKFSIPPQGSRQFRSKMASAQIVTGWAEAIATVPVQATVLFTTFVNGSVQYQVSAPATVPTEKYWSPANPNLGIAVANTYSNVPVAVNVTALDSEGNTAGKATLTVGPRAHTSINLSQVIPSLASSFNGSIVITAQVPSQNFVAWTLNSDSGALSSLPSGNSRFPISHWQRIWLVYLKILDAATPLASLLGTDLSASPPALNIASDMVINACTTRDGGVQINYALSELIGDSDSELAFIVGHEFGHVIQSRTNQFLFSNNLESDADQYGMVLTLVAGYDPYAAAGALGKLRMMSAQPGLLAQPFDNMSGDLRSSLNLRIDGVFGAIQQMCSETAELAQFCAAYKSVIHPHFPGNAPMSLPATPVPNQVNR